MPPEFNSGARLGRHASTSNGTFPDIIVANIKPRRKIVDKISHPTTQHQQTLDEQPWRYVLAIIVDLVMLKDSQRSHRLQEKADRRGLPFRPQARRQRTPAAPRASPTQEAPLQLARFAGHHLPLHLLFLQPSNPSSRHATPEY